MIFQQIKQTGMLHKVRITFIVSMTIWTIFAKIELIQMTTIFILTVYFIGSDSKKQWNTFQRFRE